MDIGVLGTGMVGQAIASRLVELGHGVRMGARDPANPVARDWSEACGDRASAGTFAEAAAFGELAFNCTAGAGALSAVESASAELRGKLLVDVCNPLQFNAEGPPTLFVGIDDSLGEQIQRALPGTSVVKALNTVNADVMVHPERVSGDHALFVCGDDEAAKARVTSLLGELGWPPARVIDVGDISGARATEAYVLLWVRLMGATGTPLFNVAVV